MINVFSPDYYGMYTDAGNLTVSRMVDQARIERWNWFRTYQELCRLSESADTAEATDTEVRENVFYRLRFHETDQPFYC